MDIKVSQGTGEPHTACGEKCRRQKEADREAAVEHLGELADHQKDSDSTASKMYPATVPTRVVVRTGGRGPGVVLLPGSPIMVSFSSMPAQILAWSMAAMECA